MTKLFHSIRKIISTIQ